MTSLNRSRHERSGEEWELIHSPAAHCHSTSTADKSRDGVTLRRFLLLSLERFSACLDDQHLYFNVSTPAVGRERKSPEPGWWAVCWMKCTKQRCASSLLTPACTSTALPGSHRDSRGQLGPLRGTDLSQSQATTLLLGTHL